MTFRIGQLCWCGLHAQRLLQPVNVGTSLLALNILANRDRANILGKIVRILPKPARHIIGPWAFRRRDDRITTPVRSALPTQDNTCGFPCQSRSGADLVGHLLPWMVNEPI